MKMFRRLRGLTRDIKMKKTKDILLCSADGLYDKFMEKPEIKRILEDMPINLNKMEKAYYVYLELGKLFSEDPDFCYSYGEQRELKYNELIDDNYYGICKSMSELYACMLKDKRIGIKSYTVKQVPNSPIAHIDVLFNIDGKNYISNLIGDLTRIQGNSRTNHFCFNLDEPVENPEESKGRAKYHRRLELKFGRLYYLTREELDKMDNKIGYSFSVKNSKGVYTEDTINQLREEFDNPKLLREYVLKNPNLSDEELENGDFLNEKLQYIFDNINKFTEFNKEMNYQERIRYLMYIARKLLKIEDQRRISAYVVVDGNEYKKLISIIKVRPKIREGWRNLNEYYLYSDEEQKYINKSHQEMRDFLNGLDKNQLQIIGKFDGRQKCSLSELELI